MVWFQCEDCGENLKKPKLPGHFRMCSATKLSCIDCGQVFGKQAVQGHTQCISEAEKYGPKGQASNGTPAKPSNDKKNADVDIHVGLSERPPWFCSLCNTQATSQQTLLLHADGKKHRAKARAFHAANQPKTTEESITAQPNNVPENKDAKEESQNLPKSVSNDEVPVSENGILPVKKRKISDSDDDGAKKHSAIDVQTELGNGEVVQNQKAVDEDKKVKKAKHDDQENGENGSSLASEKIKWKKIISSILKTTDGAVKMKKLQKLVRKSLKESGISIDVTELNNTLEHKVKTNSRFTVDGKYVRLVSRE